MSDFEERNTIRASIKNRKWQGLEENAKGHPLEKSARGSKSIDRDNLQKVGFAVVLCAQKRFAASNNEVRKLNETNRQSKRRKNVDFGKGPRRDPTAKKQPRSEERFALRYKGVRGRSGRCHFSQDGAYANSDSQMSFRFFLLCLFVFQNSSQVDLARNARLVCSVPYYSAKTKCT